MPEIRISRETERRDFIKGIATLGSLTVLAGCQGEDEPSTQSDGGGSSDNPENEYLSAARGIGFGENWEERRLTSTDDWSIETRQKIWNELGYDTRPEDWANNETFQDGPWSPPEGWEDSVASNVDSIQIFNYGGMGRDPGTCARYAMLERETGITVNPVEIGADQLNTKIRAALNADATKPTVSCMAQVSIMPDLVQAGDIEIQDPVMPDEEMWEPYTRASKAVYNYEIDSTYEGTHLYAHPNIMAVQAVHVRPDVLEEQGIDPERVVGDWTWDDLEAIMEAFEGTDKYGWTGFRGGMGHIYFYWLALVYQQGGNIVQDDGTVKYNSQSGITALQKMREWKDKGWIPEDVLTFGVGDMNQLLFSGEAAMAPNMGITQGLALEQGLEPFEEYDMTRMPKANTGPNPSPTSFANINAEGINKHAPVEKKIAALLYADARWSEEANWWEFKEGNASFMPKVYDDVEEAEINPFIDVHRYTAEHSKMEVHPQIGPIKQKTIEELQLAVAGDKDPEAAMNSIQGYIDTVLDQ